MDIDPPVDMDIVVIVVIVVMVDMVDMVDMEEAIQGMDQDIGQVMELSMEATIIDL